jgi:hypothetical protein
MHLGVIKTRNLGLSWPSSATLLIDRLLKISLPFLPQLPDWRDKIRHCRSAIAGCNVHAERLNLWRMSAGAQVIVDEIRALPPKEQRELFDFILQHFASVPPSPRARKVADIAGKYRANPDLEAKDHDRGFAAAAAD